MKMLKEFKEFVMRGNVLDLAVAVIIGAAFGRIITSLVNDILMPPIGIILGKVDFSNLFIDLSGGEPSYHRGGQSRGRGDRQLWNIPEHDHRLSDRGFRDLPGGKASEPDEETGSCGGAGY